MACCRDNLVGVAADSNGEETVLQILSVAGEELVTLTAKTSDTVLDVKRRLEGTTGISVRRQALCSSGAPEPFDNAATLNSLEIVSEGALTTLTLVDKASLPPQEIYHELGDITVVDRAFTWDTTESTNELQYDENGLTVKKTGSPDCSLVVGSVPLEEGVWFFEVHICAAQDETWIGVTSERDIVRMQHKTTDTMSTTCVCSYYDGQRSYRHPHIKNMGNGVSDASGYGTGDLIGVLVDLDQRCLCFYKNGGLEGVVRGVPDGRLWPVAHMDTGRDIYKLVRAVQLAPGCLDIDEQ